VKQEGAYRQALRRGIVELEEHQVRAALWDGKQELSPDRGLQEEVEREGSVLRLVDGGVADIPEGFHSRVLLLGCQWPGGPVRLVGPLGPVPETHRFYRHAHRTRDLFLHICKECLLPHAHYFDLRMRMILVSKRRQRALLAKRILRFARFLSTC
jgi:hypothetical protein